MFFATRKEVHLCRFVIEGQKNKRNKRDISILLNFTLLVHIYDNQACSKAFDLDHALSKLEIILIIINRPCQIAHPKYIWGLRFDWKPWNSARQYNG